MARYLVTGVAGFIGSSIAKALLAEGHQVRGIDDLSSGKKSNVESVGPKLEFVEGSITYSAVMREACQGVQCIFHQAAIPSVPKSVENPAASHIANIDGTFQVLQAARDTGIRRVIYAGSSAAYGETPSLPKREDMIPAPISPYAVQKLCGEHYMSSFARVYGMETVSLRYFNVFGPFQDAASYYSGVLAKFCSAMLTGQKPTIYGDGEQTRDFTYIDNVVAANLLASRAPAAKISGLVFNIATGRRISLNETVTLLKDITGYEGGVNYGPPREGDIKHSQADITLARNELGYEPSISFEDGLRETVEWYRTQKEVGA